MPIFCDVALAVPLDMVFTYAIPPGMEPVVGGRVLVPFRQQRLSAIVVELHDRLPPVKTKKVIEALDLSPVLDEQLMKLGKWIAGYYLAPLGEVFRTMLPLSAEFKRSVAYRITDQGRLALHLAGMSGSPARSKRTPDEELVEFRVLDYLAERESVRQERLRGAARVSKALLNGMVRKKWIAREDVSAARDAARLVKVAVLLAAEERAKALPPLDGPEARHHTGSVGAAKRLNANQLTLIETLAASGGRLPVEALRGLDVPRTTLGTLVRRGLIELVDEPQDFTASKLKPRQSPFEFEFSPAQKEALAKISEAVASRKFGGLLLHGITGSGKTAVYLACMREVLEQGRSSILLVPEIGLTPAVAADLHQVFGDEVAILHSGLSDAERAEQWHRIRRGEARVVAGTRSAVFAPVSDLALVIVDEEQDSSYKQEETPRYHARDVAVMRAKMAGAVVVLGSATPSLESYYNAKKNKYALVELPDRVEQRPLPEVEIVDMRQEFQETGQEQVVSRKLAQEIRERLEKREQVMVLLNRRGYSPVVLCRACGKTLQCRNCAVSMTHHKRERKMECHYCGHVERIPDKCVHCGSEYVYFVGTGSEKLEELLHGMFPQARIGRLDRDTVRGREDFEHALNALNEGALDMLVGTQMIAKGHDIHGVTLVGVVGADMALGLPDFRAAERTFQLLTQVAGRAGRGQSPGKVVLQTYFQDHYAVQFAARHDFAGFHEKELQFRAWMHYPPYNAIANVLIRSEKLDEALTWSGELGRWFEKTRHEGIRVLGPAAAPITRLKRDYRYHFILKSPSREKMNALLRAMLAEAAARKIPRAQVIVDVDAVWLM
ncbi:MAG TPA: primosomal protein N' [Terriglobales bacterium]|jgi:primosomal protein N' (replication factor Y) (superfamily II helicase)|nr:primosomal protein N' [Terriglobales bacterium]